MAKRKFELQFWKHSLVGKLAGASIFLVLLASILAGLLIYSQATRSLTESAYDRLEAVAALKREGLQRWINQQRANLVFTAWQSDVRGWAGNLLAEDVEFDSRAAAYEELSAYLQYVVSTAADSDELFILDLDGRVVLSTQKVNEGRSFGTAEFYQVGKTSTYVQPVYSSAFDLHPMLTVVTPLFDQDRRRVGVLASHLNLSRIDNIILDPTGMGQTGETYLVDRNAGIVSGSWRGRLPEDEQTVLRSTAISAALAGENGRGLYENYAGVPVVGVYFWLDDLQIALLAETNQAEAFAPARQLTTVIVEFGLIFMVVLAVAALWMARQIARPVLAVTQAAMAVSAGDLNQTAPVLSEDEVGQLAKTFNNMIRQLSLLYNNLEQKVADRTADLLQTNRQLEVEIRERKRAEKQLRSQNSYLEALHETAVGIVGRLDIEDLFHTIVTRAADLLDTPHGFIYIGEPDAEEIECRVGVGMFSPLVGFKVRSGEGLGGTVWSTGKPQVVDDYDHWSRRAKSIEQKVIRSIIGVPLRSGDQNFGVIGLAYDYTGDLTRKFGQDEVTVLNRFAQLAAIALDNANLYARAQHARLLAEEASESKSAFLANVSHELRTPLTSINGFTRLVQKRLSERIFPLIPPEEDKTEQAKKQIDDNLRIILSEGERLTRLIDDLLDLEKIRLGKMVWNMKDVRIGDLIERAYDATSSLFVGKGLQWALEVDGDLPLVTGDENRLVQVLINLISNAIKFTPSGTITCRAWLAKDDVIVSVIDQGIGIAADDLALVFEKFVQVGDLLTQKPSGTGLGLPICKEIIEHHGGRIWAESEPGCGSSFSFSLPVQKGEVA